MEDSQRIVWIDWLRVAACFMVMVVHSTEPFYLGGEGSLIASRSDLLWAAFFDSFVRSCVPLFLIASSFLQFPIHYSAGEFFRRRAVRILVPFAIWSVFYAFYWGEPCSNLRDLLFNFNYAAGHLWFVYMLCGLYLIMPLLSPWAEKVSRKELSVYIGIWLFTTLIPLIRDWLDGGALAVTFGPSGLPRQALYPLWGEASWNSNGAFYYVSGLIGYMLLGLWFRKFGTGISRGRSILTGIAGFLAGFAITFGGFVRRALASAGGVFPVEGRVDMAIRWETTWQYESLGVALMTIGVVLMMKNIRSDGRFYRAVVKPLSEAGYGIYLAHMVALSAYSRLFIQLIPCTPLAIMATATASFVTVSVVAVMVRRIPVAGKWIMG